MSYCCCWFVRANPLVGNWVGGSSCLISGSFIWVGFWKTSSSWEIWNSFWGLFMGVSVLEVRSSSWLAMDAFLSRSSSSSSSIWVCLMEACFSSMSLISSWGVIFSSGGGSWFEIYFAFHTFVSPPSFFLNTNWFLPLPMVYTSPRFYSFFYCLCYTLSYFCLMYSSLCFSLSSRIFFLSSSFNFLCSSILFYFSSILLYLYASILFLSFSCYFYSLDFVSCHW